MHEDQVRVPLFVAGPGVAAQNIGMPVSLVDVMPTLMELAGIETTNREGLPVDLLLPELDGRSFAGRLWAQEPSVAADSRALYAFEYSFFWSDGRRDQAAEAREEPYSVAVMRGESWYLQRESSSELYRMTNDPDQENNLLAETGLALELRELVDSRRFVSQGREHTIDSEIEQRLRSLGYVR